MLLGKRMLEVVRLDQVDDGARKDIVQEHVTPSALTQESQTLHEVASRLHLVQVRHHGQAATDDGQNAQVRDGHLRAAQRESRGEDASHDKHEVRETHAIDDEADHHLSGEVIHHGGSQLKLSVLRHRTEGSRNDEAHEEHMDQRLKKTPEEQHLLELPSHKNVIQLHLPVLHQKKYGRSAVPNRHRPRVTSGQVRVQHD
mmetsp:Transcript_18840/g.50534  ORF Transcript_18840/g.50534 Transcript_18840/m.50534 type:complete len:200 (+) Transcript_18840:877-1476(+)